MVEQLGVTLRAGEQMPLSAPATRSAEAYRLYSEGRYFWEKRTEGDSQLALAACQDAIRRDSGYSLPWVGIAQVGIFRGWYSVLAPKETFPGAKDAVNQALVIDNSLAEAHTSLARIHFEFDTAVIHAALGDFDAAFEWLDRAYEEQSPWIAFLRVDPRVDALRSDERFSALLHSARLAPPP